ncbi:putative N-acetylated-alpha-linked acidic dipeptidase [Styela clava]
MLELFRAIGAAVRNGWKPRRTSVFCSWGAEEYGLIGSAEWVEEFQRVLGSRSVAYLNVDSSIRGGYSFSGGGSPSIKNAVFEAAQLVTNPYPSEIAEGRKNVYDTWAYTNGDIKPGEATPFT